MDKLRIIIFFTSTILSLCLYLLHRDFEHSENNNDKDYHHYLVRHRNDFSPFCWRAWHGGSLGNQRGARRCDRNLTSKLPFPGLGKSLSPIHPFRADRLRRAAGEELKPRTVEAIQCALEAAGVVFIEENGGGPGVRLKKDSL